MVSLQKQPLPLFAEQIASPKLQDTHLHGNHLHACALTCLWVVGVYAWEGNGVNVSYTHLHGHPPTCMWVFVGGWCVSEESWWCQCDIHTHLDTHLHICVRMCAPLHVCACAYACVCIHACGCVCMCDKAPVYVYVCV